jgi:hypothetical protein
VFSIRKVVRRIILLEWRNMQQRQLRRSTAAIAMHSWRELLHGSHNLPDLFASRKMVCEHRVPQ